MAVRSHLSVDQLKRAAGHADVATTLKYYTSATEQDADQVLKALAANGLAGRVDVLVDVLNRTGAEAPPNGNENSLPATMKADCPRSSVG